MTPSPRRWWVCALLFAATTINYLDRVTLNQTATDIKAAFALRDVDYSRLESGFALAFGAGAILFGVVVDRFGVWRTYPLAVLGWSAAGFLTGYAPTYWALFGCRVMLGLCEAGNWPCGVRTVRQVMPPAERSFGSAVFQSGTGLGAMLTPPIVAACLWWAGPGHPTAWQVPFRVIGLVGGFWAVVWLLTVPRELVDYAPPAETVADRGRFADVFRDRRFWLLIVLVIGVNTTWHTFRVWQPLFLEKQQGFTKAEVQRFTFVYYAVADVGSWLAGGAVVLLHARGVRLHRSRVWVFAGGVAVVAVSVLVPWLTDLSGRLAAGAVGGGPVNALLPWHATLGGKLTAAVLLLTGFGALGLFATYFALSQEVSGRHQGKVTGVLGAVNAVWLAVAFEGQGRAGRLARPVRPAARLGVGAGGSGPGGGGRVVAARAGGRNGFPAGSPLTRSLRTRYSFSVTRQRPRRGRPGWVSSRRPSGPAGGCW